MGGYGSGRRKNNVVSIRDLSILQGLKLGRTYQDLAEQYGITKQRVGQLAVKHGISRYDMGHVVPTGPALKAKVERLKEKFKLKGLLK